MAVATPALRNTGAAVTDKPSAHPADLVPTLDSIVFPPFVREQQDERRVRPALAVLFRVAVGPHADYYVRRFVKYERPGKSAPSRPLAMLSKINRRSRNAGESKASWPPHPQS